MTRKTIQPSIKRNAILNSIRSVMSIAFPLITYPYVTRLLQAQNLGKVNFASSTLSYFSLIAVLGLTGYAGREGVRYRDDPQKINQFCGELLTVNLCTTLFAYLALIIVVGLTPKFHPYAGLLAIYSTTILFSTLGVEWVYTIYEDYTYITIRSILIQFVSLVLMFLLVRKESDYYIYAAINVIASVGGNIFNFIHARKYIKLKLIFNKKIFEHIRYSIVFFANSIASSIYSNIDITMLTVISSDYSVGIYSVSVKIYNMVKGILVALMTVTGPRLSYYRFQGKIVEFNSMVSKLVKTMLTFLLPTVVGINLTAREIILIISGEGYVEAIPSLRILSVAVFTSIFACISSSVLIACRKEKKILVATWIAAMTNVITNLFMIPLFQQNGAALTTVIAETVVFGVGYYYAHKDIRLESMKHVILSSGVGCIVMCAISFVLENAVQNVLYSLISKVSLCAVAYFLVQVRMKNEIAVATYFQVKSRIRKWRQ